MGLIEQAKRDWKNITTDPNGAGVELTFIAPDGTSVDVYGVHTKHNTSIDEDGMRVNSPNAHISVSEAVLTDNYYPVRDSNGLVSMRNHKVVAKDSRGVEVTYKIVEAMPDQTIGVIVFMLANQSTTNNS